MLARWCSKSIVVTALLLATIASTLPALSQSGALEVTVRAAPKSDAKEAGKVKLYTRSKALVIGIDAYTEKGWPKLSGTPASASWLKCWARIARSKAAQRPADPIDDRGPIVPPAIRGSTRRFGTGS